MSAALESGCHFASDIHGSALNEFSVQVQPVLAKEHQLARAVEILEIDDTPGFVVLAETLLYACHYSSHCHILSVLEGSPTVCQIGTFRITEVVEDDLILIQRMCREIDTHEFTLLVQPFDIAPADVVLRNGRCGDLYIVEGAEERVLGLCLLRLIQLSVAHQRIQERLALVVHGEIALTRNTEAVEATAQGQRLKGFLVDIRQVDTLRKVEDCLIRPVLLTLRDDGLCSRLSHALDGTQSETDLTMMIHTKLLIRLVHIRA